MEISNNEKIMTTEDAIASARVAVAEAETALAKLEAEARALPRQIALASEAAQIVTLKQREQALPTEIFASQLILRRSKVALIARRRDALIERQLQAEERLAPALEGIRAEMARLRERVNELECAEAELLNGQRVLQSQGHGLDFEQMREERHLSALLQKGEMEAERQIIRSRPTELIGHASRLDFERPLHSLFPASTPAPDPPAAPSTEHEAMSLLAAENELIQINR